MRNHLFPPLFLVLFLAALPASAQKIHIDFDGATAFSEYKTFALKQTGFDLRRVSSSLHERVVQQLTDYATDGGLKPDEAEPDVYIAYYAAFSGDLRLVLGDLEYTYGPGFNLGSYWDGGVGTREVSEKSFTFKEGTVVVDVWDRERKVLVWRGMATAAVKKDYERNEQKLEKALGKLMKRWEKMYGGRARAIRKMKAEQDG
ncbi:MAG: DUF4136 domain-containing protein [bacterium]|nr:DUF4136 domain-containing protein [bacterium]